MSVRFKIAVAFTVLAMINLFLFILFSDNGMMDLYRFREDREKLAIRNEKVADENIRLHRTIERLRNDPVYIESVARNELGMIGTGDLIVKPE